MFKQQIAALRIRLASPEQIRSWSSGEVTLPETINYRTHKPVPGGLFCERIFGPTKDGECACGKYRKRMRMHGHVCEKCGVLVGKSSMRRERMGHIELAVPVVHPWFARGDIIATLLGLPPRKLTAILTYTDVLVTEICEEARACALARPPDAENETEQQGRLLLERLCVGEVLEAATSHHLSLLFSTCFRAETGAVAIRTLLSQLDLDHLAEELRRGCHDGPVQSRKKASRRLQIVEAFRCSGVRPEWMVLDVLPVLPPDLRPLIPLSGGRLATSDVNALYVHVLHRNQRLRHFELHGAPAIILNQEKRLVQAAVNALFDNTHQRRPLTNGQRQPLKSLTDTLSGKTGRFRLNLLGKRVDYSGRSVIVGNPQLQLHQCGLPKKMTCELFKPFLMRKLIDRGLARTARAARRDPCIWDHLAECLFERVVLLNRAPTLHRLSIQAFEPMLVEGSAIQLHPLVCSAFNADFDGDQMAVHLPLSEAAQAEARALLLSTHNLRSPATGEPSIAISQEQVLGLFYLTQERPSAKVAGRVFSSVEEARLAYDHHHINLHTPIVVHLADEMIFEAPAHLCPVPNRGRLATTVGRLLFNEALPAEMRFKNCAMTKERLKQVIAECLLRLGEEETARLADRLKTLGFTHATRAGISFAMADIKLKEEEQRRINALIQQGVTRVKILSAEVDAGLLTEQEWKQQVIVLWTETTEQVSAICEQSLDPYGTLATIMQSGATKAKPQQIRQLNGIRGLLASPAGEIIPFPVLGNYYIGLMIWEIFIAASGARKGFMDRSLNTAMSGYLTRKLVEVGMPTWITRADCGTTAGILIRSEMAVPNLRALILGRVLAASVAGLERGTLLTEKQVHQLLTQAEADVWIRSPLTCQASHGLCQQCYGSDPATGTLVRLGTAVGVIAGQSIGEPGTQLTMRTFHSGGIANAQGDITQGLPRVSELFEARTPKKKAILSHLAGQVVIEEGDGSSPKRVRIVAQSTFEDDYLLPEGSSILVSEGASVQPGQLLALAPSQAGQRMEIRARYGGRVVRKTGRLLTLFIKEREERSYTIAVGTQLAVEHGQAVEVGTPLTVGPIDPKELLALCGVEVTARYLVSEVQRVYRNTGVAICEKHPETIVRQMLRYVQISDEGDTAYVPLSVVDRFALASTNAAILAQGGQPATARPVLLGLTRAALATSSWIAAASFQETARVLREAIIRNQRDPLRGLKEKVILGLPIPAPMTNEESTLMLG